MCAVDEVVEQEGHFRLSCHLRDHPADQLIRLQKLGSDTLLAQPVHQVVGHLHMPKTCDNHTIAICICVMNFMLGQST